MEKEAIHPRGQALRRRRIRAYGPDGVSLPHFHEAWAVEQQKDEKYIQPSKHPNRIEIVSVVFETSRFGSTMCCANITRNGDDVRLEEFSKPLQSNIGGRFSGFLRAD